jgi:hypothetical protein
MGCKIQEVENQCLTYFHKQLMTDSVLHKQYFCNCRSLYGISWEADPVDERGHDLFKVPPQYLLAGTEKNKITYHHSQPLGRGLKL